MKKLILFFFMIYFAFFQFSCKNQISSEKEIGFTNPVIESGQDPWIIKNVNDYYYCYSSDNKIFVSVSGKLSEFGKGVAIWQAPSKGWNSNHIWAPELHFFNNKWYIYYAAGFSGPPFINQRAGVLESKTNDPFGEYIDKGIFYTGNVPEIDDSNIWAIDMTVFEWQNKYYALWSGWEKQAKTDKTPQHIYISAMKDPLTLSGKRVKISSPEESWEVGTELDLNEGPQILINGKNLFIVYSCCESWLKEYKLGMLSLKAGVDNLLLPENWEKSGPVFQGTETVFGTGHASFTKSPDNSEDWIIYHSKKTISPGWDRDVRMQPFNWKTDGSPNFGKPLNEEIIISFPSGEN